MKNSKICGIGPVVVGFLVTSIVIPLVEKEISLSVPELKKIRINVEGSASKH